MDDEQLDSEENEDEEEQEQEQEQEEQQKDQEADKQKPNPEKAKDEVKKKVEKAKKIKEKTEKAKKAKKAAETAKKAKAAAKAASNAKKAALFANPYFWIAMLIILAIICLIGIIMSFTIMPSNFLGKTKKFVEGMMQQFCGFIWGDNTSPINNSSEDVKDLANYIQNMGYDIQGYGFGDVEYTDETKEQRKEVEETDEKANAIEGKRNYVTEQQATQAGEIKKVFGLQSVTTVSNSEYQDGDEMYRIAGRFSSKNNDYLRAYLSAEAATYTEATYSIKGLFNELGDIIKNSLTSIFGGHSSSDWQDPGDVGVKSSSTGMLNFTNEGGNSLFNSTFSGSPTKIKIDPKKKKLMLYEHALNLGITKIQWGHTFSVDLSNWTALYGRPLELFLALHLSSMMPDLPYQIAVDQAFNTKVNITLQDVNVNLKSVVRIDGREVDMFACDMQETGEGISLIDINGNRFVTKMDKDTFEKLLELIQDASSGDGVNRDKIDVVSESFIPTQKAGYNAMQAGCFDGTYMVSAQNAKAGNGSWQESNNGGRIVWYDPNTKAEVRELLIGSEGGHMEGLAFDSDRNLVLKTIGSDKLLQIDNDTKNFASQRYSQLSHGVSSVTYDKTRHQLVGYWFDNGIYKIGLFTYNASTNTYEEQSNFELKGLRFKTGNMQGFGTDGLNVYLADSHPDYGESKYRVWSYDFSGKKTGEYKLGDGFNGQPKEVESVTFDAQSNMWLVMPTGFFKAKPIKDGITIKFPYIESVTNHWYYHIIDFIGTTDPSTPYGVYKKATTAQKIIKYADEDANLDNCDVELTALLSSESGIFYQVCEPYLNQEPSKYLKTIFNGIYYKYDGTTDTARKIAAARAIESAYGTDDYNDSHFEKDPQVIADKKIKYNWHSSDSDSSKIVVNLEDATEYVNAKAAQVQVQAKADARIEMEESDDPDSELLLEENNLNLGELGEESPMCKKLVEFKSNKSNTLEAFSILENVNSEAAEVNYRLLKKLMVEMDYFTEDEMNCHEKNVLLWVTNVEGKKGKDIAEKIDSNLGQTDDGKYKTISDTSRDANEYGVVISNFMYDTNIIAPGDAKVKKTGTDDHGEYIELEFSTFTDDKVYPLQGQMMLLHQDDERDPYYNIETPFGDRPVYSAADVMRNYRFRDTYQVFENDDLVGITMKISGLKNIKFSQGQTVLRGEKIADNPEVGADGDTIYVEMKKADKTKIENVEDYIDPTYTYEDEKEMAEQLWYLDHPEFGNKYVSGGSKAAEYGSGSQIIQGANNEETIWFTLIGVYGYSPEGAAAIMGNWYCESGLMPNNAENTYNSSSGMSDEEITTKIDNGEISKDSFVNTAYGYGLAQWTYWSRKEAMYDYMKNAGLSIADLGGQIGFADTEMKNINCYGELTSKDKTRDDIYHLTELYHDDYERSAGRNIDARASAALEIYDRNINKAIPEYTGYSGQVDLDYVQWAIDNMANDDRVGYNTPNPNDWKYSDTGSWDVDCSSMVYYALKETRYPEWGGTCAMGTANEPDMLKGKGFVQHPFNSIDELQTGDILWVRGTGRDGKYHHHTEIYVGDGKNVGAHMNYDGQYGDSGGKEVSVSSCGTYFTHYFREGR